MSPIDSYRASKAQNSIAEAVRVAVRRAMVTLDLPDNAATAKLVVEALRNAAQTFQTRADCDMDPALGEPETFDNAEVE